LFGEGVTNELMCLNAIYAFGNSSAGIGRTGTFIALSSLLPSSVPLSHERQEIPSELGALPHDLLADPVARTVDQMREQRGMMVQTREQLELIYRMVCGEGER
jgi:protein-tyrosine phosphatase